MNGENYYFQTGLSAVIYKIYRWTTGRPIIGKSYNQRTPFDDPLAELTEPEFKHLKGNIWHKMLI